MLELDGATLTYEEFCRLCLEPNHPAIIRNACQGLEGTFFDLLKLKSRLSPLGLTDALGTDALVPVYPNHFTATAQDTQSKAASSPSGERGAPLALDGTNQTAEAVVRDTVTAEVTDGCKGAAEMIEGDNEEEKEEEEGACREMPLRSVLKSWTRSSSGSRATNAATARVYYLKDWHLQEALENAATTASTGTESGGNAFSEERGRGVHGNSLYRVPAFLGADWMDPFCRFMQSTPPSCDDAQKEEAGVPACSNANAAAASNADDSDQGGRAGFGNNRSDYRFAYIGPVGSWTPLHCDVFGTYSWSFNVCGDKLWFFPTVAGNAYLHTHLLPFFPTPPDIRVLTGFEMEGVVQHPGDLVFVPARFYHQVHNITGEIFSLNAKKQNETSTNVALQSNNKEEGMSVLERATPSMTPEENTVGPLTMALNHNWCNVYNIECMTRAFLSDAQRLVTHLSVDDLAIICDTSDVEVWRRYVDTMLHGGTNWSYASMTCFLKFCASRVKSNESEMLAVADERAMAVGRLQELLAEVRTSRRQLFSS